VHEDVEASRDKPEISEGKWFLSRVGAETDEELTPRPYGKEDADAAIEQAERLLSTS
jgi:HEPN domain-containing protein